MAKKSIKNTPTDAKKPEPKKSELDNITLADGKTHLDPDIEKVKKLEEILGIRKMNPFGTSNIDVLRERLNEMAIVVDIKKIDGKKYAITQGGNLSNTVKQTNVPLTDSNILLNPVHFAHLKYKN